MAVESVTYINSLDPSLPSGGDSIAEGDDHIRNLKKGIKNTFPNVTGEVSLSNKDFSDLKDQLDNPSAHEMVASCKYNGIEMKYGSNIRSVTPNGNAGYTVQFNSPIPNADEHFAVSITPFVSAQNTVVVASLVGFASDSVTFSMTEIKSTGPETPDSPVGFSLIIIDME